MLLKTSDRSALRRKVGRPSTSFGYEMIFKVDREATFTATLIEMNETALRTPLKGVGRKNKEN